MVTPTKACCNIVACSYAMATPNKDETVTEDEAEEDAVPEEIEEQCIDCHHALASLERLLKPLLETTHTAVEEKVYMGLILKKSIGRYNTITSF